MPVFDLLTPEE